MINKNLSLNQCKAAIVCLEVKVLFEKKFKIENAAEFIDWSHKLRQFGYNTAKEKEFGCVFDVVAPEYLISIQHYECLQYLLSFDPDIARFELIVKKLSKTE
jgi:hypothetical protein